MMSAPRADTAVGKKLVAHRGASAYAPEHTLASYRLALQQKADFVEQDLAVTKDLVLICLHDESLRRTTNVEELFPDRAVVDPATGRVVARRRFHAQRNQAARRRLMVRCPLRWRTHSDVGRGRDVGQYCAGLYPELKTPALYRARGIPIRPRFWWTRSTAQPAQPSGPVRSSCSPSTHNRSRI